MRARDALSELTLPLLGAAVLTAGAVLYQIARRPTPEMSPGASSGESRPGSVPPPLRKESSGDVALHQNESLVKRLREHGL